MGIRWRRLNERVKQRLHLTSTSFLATSNRRCEMMFEEAAQFAVHLRRMETDIKKIQDDAEKMLVDTRNIMLCSLPSTFDFSPSGQAVPEDPDPQMIGQNVKVDRFSVAMQVIRQKMEEEVMEPLRNWLAAYNNAVERMKVLESLRLELDSRRRTVDLLKERVDRQKTMLESGTLRSASAHDLSVKKLHHKEEKKNSSQSSFGSYETEVFKILHTLNKDTTYLRDYTALAYNILSETFGAAESAFQSNGMLVNSPSMGSDSPLTPSIHGRRHSSVLPAAAQKYTDRLLMVRHRDAASIGRCPTVEDYCSSCPSSSSLVMMTMDDRRVADPIKYRNDSCDRSFIVEARASWRTETC